MARYARAVPAEAVHLTALREALAARELGTPARKLLVRHDAEARLGAVLVDLPYFDRFWSEVVRFALDRPSRPSAWGSLLHDRGPVELLLALVRLARARRDGPLGALALGLASHAVVDRALHPLVNALATARARERPGLTHDVLHKEVEKLQSVCFHELYAGRDAMGTAAMARYVAVPLAWQLDRDPLTGLLLRAFTTAYGGAPRRRELVAWGRSYRSYASLLASPLGKRLAPTAEKAWARTRYLTGPWGSFEAALSAAVTRSLPVLDAVASAVNASDVDGDAADGALVARLPKGSIDGMGDDLDLSRPFRP